MLWIIFGVLIIVPLAIDLGIFQRKSHAVEVKEALIWSAVWIFLALVFCAGVWWHRGPELALQFLAGYLVEKSLSVDNIFVFIIIFKSFRVSREHQPRILFWGILGALAIRAVMIVAGTALIHRFEWLFYVLGAFLIFTGARMIGHQEIDVDPKQNIFLRIFKRFFPVTHDHTEDHFLVKREGRWMATPLLTALIVVEGTDIIFALDSIPAVLAVSTDTFIVYTSNIFAILGLRNLYFALAGMMDRFRHLHYGLAAILIFVGIKMAIKHFYEVPITVALGGIVLILATSVWTSLHAERLEERAKTR